jgi:Xaa-Pro dipeptidase
MSLKRRDFLRLTAGNAAAGTVLFSGLSSFNTSSTNSKASLLNDLKPMTDDVVPISVKERESRIEKAQRLMIENKIEALVLDCGTSLEYFTGIKWWPSERTMVAVIPARGEVKYVSPAFEAAARSKRRTPTSSTSCCRCSTPAA